MENNTIINGIREDIKNIPNKYREFKAFFKETYNKRIIYMYVVDALLLAWIIEMLARHSLLEGIYYLISSPYVLICNAMIILITLSVTLLMKRRIFGMAIISIIWLGLGLTNSILLSCRVTPLTAVDLLLVDSALDIANKYLSIPVIILIGVLLVLAISGLVYVWIRIPKVNHKIKIVRNVGAIAIIFAIGMGTINLGLNSQLLESQFRNLRDSYYKNGFVYCFVNSLLNTGVDKPKNYSEDAINKLKNNEENKKVEEKPNIIFLQLESFFDVNNMVDWEYSENPLPTFTELKHNYPHGYFNVPIVGAGTVNTEFEVMTGMNLDDFGPGEYPFKMVLTEKTCESICYNLKNYKYACHAVHNNTATFYGRNEVFSNLGYDTFTSIENMHIDELTPMGWAKDKFLTETIVECLDSTKKKKDFIYTISVQGHGSYPSEEADYPIKIVKGLEDDDERRYSFEYYINQLNEMDIFLKELTDTLAARDEKTILVMYGDHLPSLGITEEELINRNVYQTEYIIWSNYDIEYDSEELEAYQLQAKILEKLNMTAGDINFYSQSHRLDEDQEAYLEGLASLEYDMLYGEQLVFNGENPYKPTDIKLGLEEVKINSISPMYDLDGTIYVYGNNFTQYSKVYVNDEKKDTLYIDESTLVILYPELQVNDAFSVYQQNSDTHVLSKTEALVYQDENLGVPEQETTTEVETTKKKKNKKKKKSEE